MPTDRPLYVGLMSGTSMDGIDAVLVHFTETDQVEVISALTLPYPDTLKVRLTAMLHPRWQGSLAEILEIDSQIGASFAIAAKQVIGQSANQVGAIGMHGQTIWHQPTAAIPSTWQAGNPALVAEKTRCTVIADWRRRDMAAGGEGAPLAPAFHAAFFRSEAEKVAVLNLGGIANLTILDTPTQGQLLGFDTGPANTLMDKWCLRHRQQPYDDNGHWAATGSCVTRLLEQLLNDPYFHRAPPKSTGPEHFSLDWLQSHLAQITPPPDAADVQQTLLQLTVESVAISVTRHAPVLDKLLLCGGGSRNAALVAALTKRLPMVSVQTTASYGIDPDYLEAIAFAWFARQTHHGIAIDTRAATGAHSARILGAIYPAS